MAITRQKKEEILQALVESFGKSKSIVFAANNGLTVSEISELRKILADNGISFKVAKKNLILLACTENNIEGVTKEMLDGPVGAACSFEDEVAAAKTLATFAKKHKRLVLVSGVMDGKAMSQQQVNALSQLPSKEELLAKFMGSLQAPLSGFVGIGSNLISGFVRALDQVREQKEAAS